MLNHKLRFRILFLALLLCSLAVTSEEPYYTWVDENGVTNFSEKKPIDRETRELTKPAPRFAQLFTDDNDDEEEEIVPVVVPESKFGQNTRRVNCDRAEKSMEQLTAYKAVLFRGEDGFYRELSEVEKQEKIAATQLIISENCIPPVARQ